MNEGSAGIFGGATARLRSWFGGGVGSRPRPEAFPGSSAAAFGGFAPDHSGSWITTENVLTIPAVYAAVNAISSDLASLPVELRRPGPSGGSEVVRDHPAARLLSRSPDGGATTVPMFLRALTANALISGNGYGRIAWSGGYPTSLRILDPARVRPVEAAGAIDYDVAGEAVPGSQVLHLAALSLDGREGESPVELCRQTLGLSRAVESYAAAYFGNGASVPGFFAVPGDAEKITATRQHIRETFSGPANRHVPGVFQAGTSYQEVGGSPAEAQLLELRGFQILEVARIFGVPPHRLGDYSKASYASVEQSNLHYYLSTLRPWCESIEAVLSLRLLTEAELSAGWHWRFDFGAILRADTASRAAWIRNLAASGLLRVDEGRELADLPPIGGEAGRAILIPLNTGPLATVLDQPKPESAK